MYKQCKELFSKNFYNSFTDAIKLHLPSSTTFSYLIFVSSIVSIPFSIIQNFSIANQMSGSLAFRESALQLT